MGNKEYRVMKVFWTFAGYINCKVMAVEGDILDWVLT